jgi:aryl-alcohol dehydrogenase-like predicted oxidoreductase
MSDEGITRRKFLGAALATTATLALAALPPGDPRRNPLAAGPPVSPGKLPQRLLGRTGVMVSILGLGGAWEVGECVDKAFVEELLNAALDGGINYFDTAHNYNHSEENMGIVMATPRRKEVFLATKVEDRTYDGAMRDFEISLQRLRTDYVDLLQMHYINPKDDLASFGKPDGVIAALHKLREQKAVRFLGVTGHPEFPQVKVCLDMYDDFDTFLGFFNPALSTRPTYDDQLPIARRKRMGVIAMKVFGGGNPPGLVGAGPGKASAAELLRYAMSQDIATVIPAVSTLEHLRENLEIARNFVPMTPEEREAIVAKINHQPDKQASLTIPYPYRLA